MNFKWIIFLVLFVFLIMGTVNAEDNATSDEVIQDVNPDDINVTFDEKMWDKNLTDINVDLPEDAAGNFTVKINDEVIYNETITSCSFKVPIKLPKPKIEYVINIYPPIDCKTYKVSAFYNDIDLNINKTLKVMKYPSDIDLLGFPQEILQYGRPSSLMVFPRSANGTVEFYIDDEFIRRTNAQPIIYWEDGTFTNLALGNHSLRVVYFGDDYYRPFNKTFNFTVTNVVISIPKIVNIGHDDCISVETLQNVVGEVKVYIDNNMVYTSKTENGDFILSLEKYLKVDSREVKVVYSNKDFTRTKVQSINITYDIDIYSLPFTYGEENVVEIMLPDTLNNKLLTVTINGVKYSFTHPAYIMNNVVEVDVSKLAAGNYSMLVSFAGDSRFEAKNKTYNFTIGYGIVTPSFEVSYKDSSKIYLNLPNDAKGNLVVYADGMLVKSTKLANGHAEILIDMLSPGSHTVNASYTGEDYNVSDVVTIIEAEPKIIVDYRFTAGENKYVAIEVPKGYNGYAVFEIDGVVHKVNIKNGIARYSLSKLKPGEHEIKITCSGSDMSVWRIVTVYKPKIKIVKADLTYKNANIQIKLLNKNKKPMANKKVTVIVNNKKYVVKTNKKGIATLAKKININSKKSKVTVKFMGKKVTKKVKVKRIFLSVSRTSKKLILKANVKNPSKNNIVFKVNGKTFNVNLNKKGISKLTIKKPKVGKVNVKATYIKESVTTSIKL